MRLKAEHISCQWDAIVELNEKKGRSCTVPFTGGGGERGVVNV